MRKRKPPDPKPHPSPAPSDAGSPRTPKRKKKGKKRMTFPGAGGVIYRLRTARGWTLEQLATKVKVNRSTLHRYEADLIPLSDVMIKRLARALGVDELQLLADCLEQIQPTLKNTSLGDLIGRLIAATKRK